MSYAPSPHRLLSIVVALLAVGCGASSGAEGGTPAIDPSEQGEDTDGASRPDGDATSRVGGDAELAETFASCNEHFRAGRSARAARCYEQVYAAAPDDETGKPALYNACVASEMAAKSMHDAAAGEPVDGGGSAAPGSARACFGEFVAAYPDDPLAADASYRHCVLVYHHAMPVGASAGTSPPPDPELAACFRRSADTYPDGPHGADALAEACLLYEAAGQRGEAVRCVDDFVARYPDDLRVEELRAWREQLGSSGGP